MKILAALFFVFFSISASGEEPSLSNIRQLTFASMGFTKAGEAYFSPDERTIIFQAVPEGKKEYQMYLMEIDEGLPRMVSTGKGACTCGNFHPDGERLIFASSHGAPYEAIPAPSSGQYKWELTPYMNIYEAPVEGGPLKALTSGEAYHAECAYSPDGKEIVYASNEDGSMNIYIMAADGSNVRKITETTGCYNGGCFFSPDGKKVLFRADRDKADYLQLYTINSDGTDERQLTSNDAVNWAPYWHPDGEHIAFTKSVNNHRTYAIFLLNSLTGEEKRITHGSTFDGLPVFNCDGTKLLWTSKRGDDGSCQIFIADFTIK